jgi:dUTP pyrophosphatase
MNKVKVKIINRSNNPDPSYATPGAAGMDVRAFISEPIELKP